jgi:ADP-heptose:LPS heptosyltransferase
MADTPTPPPDPAAPAALAPVETVAPPDADAGPPDADAAPAVPPPAPVRHPADYLRVLVIRHGALGDFVQSIGPMQAIRRFHPKAEFTLLTTAALEPLGAALGLFERIWIDRRPSWWDAIGWLATVHRLRRGRFDRVYDLQTSSRSARYFRAMGRPEWSGHVPGCALPDPDPARDRRHTIDRQRGQLAGAGITDVLPSDLSRLGTSTDLRRFRLGTEPYVLLVPGGSAHRPGKRWPEEKYATLARRLAHRGVTPILIGAGAERALLASIAAKAPLSRNLCGQTGYDDIATLARSALGAIGNDTGPMHLVAMAGCRALVLFSGESDPRLCAPRPGAEGGEVRIIQRENLAGLSVDLVEQSLPFAVARSA